MARIEFEWMGFHLLEPMSLVTNSLISIFCLIFFFRIERNNEYSVWWSRFFILMAISSFTGGIAHLFANYITYELKWLSWGTISLSIFCAEMGSSELLIRKKWRKFIRIQALIRLVLILSFIIIFFNFELVKINSTIGMIAVIAGIHFNFLIKKQLYSSAWIMAGVIWGIIPSLVHTFNLNIHLWFNRDDLAHVILIPTFLLIFIGVSKIIKSNFLENYRKEMGLSDFI